VVANCDHFFYSHFPPHFLCFEITSKIIEINSRSKRLYKRLLFRLPKDIHVLGESKRKSQRLHEAQINTKHAFSIIQLEGKLYLQTLMTGHVRWPGQTSGAFGLALIFLVLFASRQKEHKSISNT